MWVGPNFGQKGPGVFGLPFKNRFRFGLRKVKGLWVRNKISRRERIMIGLNIMKGLIINNGLWV